MERHSQREILQKPRWYKAKVQIVLEDNFLEVPSNYTYLAKKNTNIALVINYLLKDVCEENSLVRQKQHVNKRQVYLLSKTIKIMFLSNAKVRHVCSEHIILTDSVSLMLAETLFLESKLLYVQISPELLCIILREQET